jgi:pimeloyl-ACP methyl ester carboxylesterase
MDLRRVRARGLEFPALEAGSGPLVVCLHGFPDCLRSFRHQLPQLAQAGYRAFAPSLRGYAPSALGPVRDAHALEAARDVLALMDALEARSAYVVGHDWGAVVGYLVAALAPERVRALCALSVPHPLGFLESLRRHPGQAARSAYMAAFQVPRIPELALAARDFAAITALWRTWSPGFTPPSEELRAVKRTLAEPGVLPRALAYYRALPRLLAGEARELLRAPLLPPVLGVVGEVDGCVAADAFLSAMAPRRFRSVETQVVAGVGHFLHQEAPAEVGDRVCWWLARHG